MPALGAVVALVAVAIDAREVLRQRDDALRASEQLALSLADMSAGHLARTFETIDRTLGDAAWNFEDRFRRIEAASRLTAATAHAGDGTTERDLHAMVEEAPAHLRSASGALDN